MRLRMSLVDNQMGELFRKFMPLKKEITNIILSGVYALQQYDFKTFIPQTTFEKWACIEVKEGTNMPAGMETFYLDTSMYAVFIHKGNIKDFVNTMGFIIQVWLPNSSYQLDNSRPHFEYMGENYLGHDNPLSEEEVWIPIKK